MSYAELAKIAETEFADIVLSSGIESGKLRLFIIDGSFVDVWASQRLERRFAYHWERRAIDGRIYRLDNRPHEELKGMRGFPRHFHDGSDSEVKESQFCEEPKEALRQFLKFVREKVKLKG